MKKKCLKLRLVRSRSCRGGVTDGQLTDGAGERICDTAERTACLLAPGVYELRCRYNVKYEAELPAIYRFPYGDKVWGWLRPGNGAYNLSDRSIIVGETFIPGIVLKSQALFEPLFERINACWEQKGTVFLEVF